MQPIGFAGHPQSSPGYARTSTRVAQWTAGDRLAGLHPVPGGPPQVSRPGMGGGSIPDVEQASGATDSPSATVMCVLTDRDDVIGF